MADGSGPYILYGGGVTRAIGPQMVLEEGRIPYELKVVDEFAGEHKSPEYLAMNPAGYIPTLITPEREVLHEAAAMMIYLAERHALYDLIPPPGDPIRGHFFCKLFYHTNDIQPAMSRFFRPERHSDNPEHAGAIRDRARKESHERWSVLNDYLSARGPYHLGDRFSLVDLHMAMWAGYGLLETDEILQAYPAVSRCYELTAERPFSGPLLRGLADEMQAWRAKDGSIDTRSEA